MAKLVAGAEDLENRMWSLFAAHAGPGGTVDPAAVPALLEAALAATGAAPASGSAADAGPRGAADAGTKFSFEDFKRVYNALTTAGDPPGVFAPLWTLRREQRPEWAPLLARAQKLAVAARSRSGAARAAATARDRRLLRGQAWPRAEQSAIYLFVSSTFTDMRAERNALLADVLPLWKLLAQTVGLTLATCDLRWGIRDEATNDHRTSEICMSELARCKAARTNARSPFFLALIGNKYGYRPFPAVIPAAEWDALVAAMAPGPQQALAAEWFRLDENPIPPVRVLKPRPASMGDAWWDGVFAPLQAALRAASEALVRAGSMSVEAAERYTIAITEDEVVAGVLRQAAASGRPVEGAFLLRRSITGLAIEDPAAGLYADRSEAGARDADAQRRVDALREVRLQAAIPPGNIVSESVPWHADGIGPHTPEGAAYMRRALDAVCGLLGEAILEEADSRRGLPASREAAEARDHWVNALEHAAEHVGREDVLTQIQAYLDAPSNGAPLVLFGESGCGKSSLLSAAAAAARARLRGAQAAAGLDEAADSSGEDAGGQEASGGAVIIRLLGTTPDSSSARGLLASLCRTLATLAGADSDPSVVATAYNGLVSALPGLLSGAQAALGGPLVLFLDSLDQLDDSDSGRELAWLPAVLPERVWLVLSTLPEEGGCMAALKRRPAEPGARWVPVPAAPAAEWMRVVDTWLARDARTLQPEQRAALEGAIGRCPLPLYVRLAYNISRGWRSYSPPVVLEPTGGSDAPAAPPEPAPKAGHAPGPSRAVELGDSVEDLIAGLFQRLAHDHGAALTDATLAALTAARGGLSFGELEDVLSCDNAVLQDIFQYHLPPSRRVPQLPLTRLLDDLRGYVAERGADGQRVLTWYHRQFRTAAERRVFRAAGSREAAAGALADYFSGRWAAGKELQLTRHGKHWATLRDAQVPEMPLRLGAAGSGHGPLNLRMLRELPAALLAAGPARWAEAAALMADLRFAAAKAEAGMLDDYIADLRALVDAGDPAAGPAGTSPMTALAAAAADYLRFARSHGHTLRAEPALVWQLAANAPPGSAPAAQAARLRTSARGLGGPWVEEVRGPRSWDPCVLALQMPSGEQIRGAVFTPDGAQALTASGLGGVRAWDAHTGSLRRSLPLQGPAGDVAATGALQSPDGRLLACGSDAGLFCWRLADAALLWSAPSVSQPLAFDPAGSRLVAGNGSCLLAILDAATGAVQVTIDPVAAGWRKAGPSALDMVRSANFDPSDAAAGATFAVATEYGKVQIFSVEGKLLRELRSDQEAERAAVRVCAYRPGLPPGEGPQLMIGLGGAGGLAGRVELWAAAEGRLIRELTRAPRGDIAAAAWSPDGSRLALGAYDYSVWLLDAEGHQLAAIESGHTGVVTAVAFGPGGRVLLSASEDGTAKAWLVEELIAQAATKPDPADAPEGGHINDLAFTSRGDRLLSVAGGLLRERDVGSRAPGRTLGGLAPGEDEGRMYVYKVAPCPEGRRLAAAVQVSSTGYKRTHIRLYELADLSAPFVEIGSHAEQLLLLLWSPDGCWLASSCVDGSSRLWDLAPGTGPGGTPVGGRPLLAPRVEALIAGPGEVSVVVEDYEGRTVMVCERRGTQTAAEVAAELVKSRVAELTGAKGGYTVNAKAFAPDSSSLLVAIKRSYYGFSDKVLFHSIALQRDSIDGRGPARIATPVLPVQRGFALTAEAAYSPNGRCLLTACSGSTLSDLFGSVWAVGPNSSHLEGSGSRVEEQAPLFRLAPHGGSVQAVAWSPSGRRMATCGADRCVFTFDAASGTRLHVWAGAHPAPQLAWCPTDERLLAAGDRAGRVYFLRLHAK